MKFGFFACLLILVGSLSSCVYKEVNFSIGCGDHLKRAADANTVEIAQQEMSTVVDYLEKNNLKSGNSSVFFQMPTNDIEFWYKNMVAAKQELDAIPAHTTRLERTNVLMKLRETLMDGDIITTPSSISVYPNQRLFFWLITISLLGASISGITWVVVEFP